MVHIVNIEQNNIKEKVTILELGFIYYVESNVVVETSVTQISVAAGKKTSLASSI